jgi:hypothetical protein
MAHQRRITTIKRQIWQAEFIGWPALAESFRQELQAFMERTTNSIERNRA